MSEAPPFWWQQPGWQAWMLAPVSYAYGWVAAKRMGMKPSYGAGVPVLCVGNLIAGGAGKTPTALAIAKAAKRSGLKPGFLSRGYGGKVTTPTLVDSAVHIAYDVGDEPLLLAARFPTVVSANRVKGAALLETVGIDFIVMDDGFQNHSVRKDYALVVVDARRGIGNGFAMPSGPLRAQLGAQLSLANSVLVIGDSSGADRVIRTAAKRAKPIYLARLKIVKPRQWKGRRVLALAGIADPGKFHDSLQSAGAEIVLTRDFPDHHQMSEEECRDVLALAEEHGVEIATTSKDAVRLARGGPAQEELLARARILEIEIEFDNDKELARLIGDACEAARQFRLGL